MIRTSKQAIAVALRQTHNVPGTCQKTVREWFNAPSAGDRDHDDDADAVDGWLSEPTKSRHFDRNPPPGKPLAFSGGSEGFGHRAMSVEGGVRSTDMAGNRYARGITSTVSGGVSTAIGILERSMGVTYLGWSDTITGIPIPPDPKPAPKKRKKKVKRTFAHVSLQFNDTDKQHAHDIEKIFSQKFHHITGTEAGPKTGNTNKELIRCAKKYGYNLSLTNRYDTWVAVRKTVIAPGSWTEGAKFVVWRASKHIPKPRGRWGDKGIVWGQYKDKDLGEISLGSIHRLTRRGAGVKLKEASDKAFATKCNTWGKNHAAGSKLAFIAGDMNTSDKNADLFPGSHFTTCWDELKVYPNTGHGNIDVIASWDKDARVKCVSARAHDDKNFFLNTDHFMITATYEIEFLK